MSAIRSWCCLWLRQETSSASLFQHNCHALRPPCACQLPSCAASLVLSTLPSTPASRNEVAMPVSITHLMSFSSSLSLTSFSSRLHSINSSTWTQG